MTELEDFFDESIRKRRITKACGRRRERAEEKEKNAKEAEKEKPSEEEAHEEDNQL